NTRPTKGDRKAAKTSLGEGGTEDKANLLENSQRDTWAHARAALVLRKEAVATVMRWIAGAKTVQVTYRAFRCRSSYQSLLTRRRQA
ncbi:unnamed protein product, partial [Sphacelaria rigidula]